MAKDSEPLNITLNIQGSRLRLVIPRNDEALYRQAADRLNYRIMRYRESYPNVAQLPLGGHLLLAAVDSAYYLVQERKHADRAPINDRLHKLNAELEAFLQRY